MKNEWQTLRLFNPLFPHIYRRNEWDDYENKQEDLTSSEILEYKDVILDRIEAVKKIIAKVAVLSADRIRVTFDGGAKMEVELPHEQQDKTAQHRLAVSPLEQRQNCWYTENANGEVQMPSCFSLKPLI